jgi:hypothetical protein
MPATNLTRIGFIVLVGVMLPERFDPTRLVALQDALLAVENATFCTTSPGFFTPGPNI